MTYEVQFKIGDAEYTVRGPDTAGMLALIDGLEPKAATQRQDAAEATLTRMGYTWNGGVLWRPPIGPAPKFEETPLPAIEPANEGCIAWYGGGRPVPDLTEVTIRQRDNDTYKGEAYTFTWYWADTRSGRDIVAYKVHPCA